MKWFKKPNPKPPVIILCAGTELATNWKKIWKIMMKSGNWDCLRYFPQHFPKGAWEHVQRKNSRKTKVIWVGGDISKLNF